MCDASRVMRYKNRVSHCENHVAHDAIRVLQEGGNLSGNVLSSTSLTHSVVLLCCTIIAS